MVRLRYFIQQSFILLPAFALLTSCTGKKVETVDTKFDPTDQWLWKIPSPPTPPMAWVPAGPFRTSDRTPENVTAIVIHTTEGGYKDEQTFAENQNRNFAGVVNYFKNNDRQVSAHYVMGPNGEIAYMVNEKDVAHTQTYYNGRAFGIECAGWSRYEESWTPEMMDSLVELCAYLCVKWEIPAVHPEGTAYEGPWSMVVDEDTKRFTGPGLVGHFQVQPWNKTDPGDYFPWEEFEQRVQARIREYGVEPIMLPDPSTIKDVVVTSGIKEETVKAGEPFTWMLTITGPDVGNVEVENVMFPKPENISNVELVSAPIKTESSNDRAVFEMKMKTTNSEAASLHAGRVNLNGVWHDSPTVRVRPEK